MVCHVVESTTCCSGEDPIVHVAVSWFHAIVQAIPQVQVVESVKVHTVDTVNVVPQDRESKS